MSRKLWLIGSIVLVFALILSACSTPAPTSAPSQPTAAVAQPTQAPAAQPAPSGYGETLKTVKARGELICGVNGQVPGFSYVDPQGNFSGFDVDFCRALSAAIFGTPDKVQYRQTTTGDRFTALQTGEIDVLIRNTTWTLTRDTENSGNFVPTTFYDGQGIMVTTASGITDLKGLEGGTVCVQTGTTTELNLADQMSANGVNYTPTTFQDADGTYGAYAEGRCDAVTSDKSQLVARRTVLADPSAHVILDVTLSKEPLGPMVRHGDDNWFDIVKWTVFATFAAEEYGVDSQNADQMLAESTNPEIQRLLGKEAEGAMGPKLGLSADWAFNVIKSVGNYAEIYNRNLGPDTPTFIPRGLNTLYTEGGLLYSPPFR